MAFAGGVFHENDFPGIDGAHFAIAGGQLRTGIEIDDVLAARCGVPVEVINFTQLK